VIVHEMTACPVCATRAATDVDLGDSQLLRRCASCATVYAPRHADASEIYADGYLWGKCGAFGSPATTRTPTFQDYLARVSLRRLGLLEAVTGRLGALLDVGCGTGEFLAQARSLGARTTGVEPVEDAARFSREQRGLDVLTATLEESGLPEQQFDVVSALHVLEHMPESVRFLETLARWTRPGGHVLIEVPNYDGMVRRRRLSNWPGLRPLEHIVHFTPATLRTAFARAGLEPRSITSPTYVGPPQTLEFALDDLALDRERWSRALAPTCRRAQRDGGPARIPTRLTWAPLRTIERVYDRRGRGTVVLGIARVPWQRQTDPRPTRARAVTGAT
jgi:SAM-dependent methyltransferase